MRINGTYLLCLSYFGDEKKTTKKLKIRPFQEAKTTLNHPKEKFENGIIKTFQKLLSAQLFFKFKEEIHTVNSREWYHGIKSDLYFAICSWYRLCYVYNFWPFFKPKYDQKAHKEKESYTFKIRVLYHGTTGGCLRNNEIQNFLKIIFEYLQDWIS